MDLQFIGHQGGTASDSSQQRIQELEEVNKKLQNRINELEMLNNNLKNQLDYFQTKFLEANLMDDSKDISSCLSDIYNSLSFDSSTSILGSDNSANSVELDSDSGKVSPRNTFRPIQQGDSTNNISPDNSSYEKKQSSGMSTPPPQTTSWASALIPVKRSRGDTIIIQKDKVNVTTNPSDSYLPGLPRQSSNKDLLTMIKNTSVPPLPPTASSKKGIRSKTDPVIPTNGASELPRLHSPSAPGARPNTPPVSGHSHSDSTTSEIAQLVVQLDEQEEERMDDPNLLLIKNEAGNLIVRGGTLEKLVQRLSYEGSHDIDFSQAFLLTYRSFTTATEVLDMLINSYNANIDETKYKNRKKIIKLRIANVIKKWLDKHFHDFQNDAELLSKLETFVTSQIQVDFEAVGKNIKKFLTNERQAYSPIWSQPPPTPLTPKKSSLGNGEFQLRDLDPTEIARQMAIIESELYRKIEAKECLNQSWNKSDKEERAPHIVAMIKRFNQVSNWVATEIVQQDRLKDRVAVIKQFIYIADKCRELGNFNGLMEIISGLQNSSVWRLKKTWEKIESKPELKNIYDDLLTKTASKQSYKEYRNMLHTAHPPCVPYLGIYLTDLTFIEDGNKNTLNNRDDLINFEKRRKVSVVIREIQQYQQQPYNLETEESTAKYLRQLPSSTESHLYKLSLICEPKEVRNSLDGGSNNSSAQTINNLNTSSNSLQNSLSR